MIPPRDRPAAAVDLPASDRLAVLRPRADGPVTLVFGTHAFHDVIARWISHAQAAGCRDYRVVCMDERLLARLRRERGASRAVSYFELFPDARRVHIDAIGSNRGRLRVLTPLRVRLFRALADHGIDFIHSDADAYWLRDPRPWLARHLEYDLLCSQGSHIPRAHFDRHGFALCAGFFLCRANERTRRLWAAVDARRHDYPSDQRRLNAVLLSDPQRYWRIREPRLAFSTYFRPWRLPRWLGRRGRVSRWFRLPLGERAGEHVCRWLNGTGTRRWFQRALRLCRTLCMITSEHVIDGRFRGGLRVGVIPMSMIPRVRIEGDGRNAEARWHVRHTVDNKSMIEEAPRQPRPIPMAARLWQAVARPRRR